jgi:hypothetical protein
MTKCSNPIRILLASFFVASSTGCALVDSLSPFSSAPPPISAPELWAELDDYTSSITSEVRRASELVRDSTAERSTQRAALRWKIDLTTMFRRAMAQDDPLDALLDLWSLTVQVRQGLEATRPFVDLRTAHEETLAAVRLLETDVRAIANKVLNDALLKAAIAQIEDYSRAHPLAKGFGREVEVSESRTWTGYSALEFALAIPLSPIRALEGIDTGAQAIADFATVADRFSTVVSTLPESLRWQAEMLVFDLDNTPSLLAVEKSATSLAASSQRIATVTESLPSEFDRAVQAAIDRVVDGESRLAPIVADARAAASEANLALASLDRAVTGARELTTGLDRVTTEFASAGKEWAEALTVLRDITQPEKEPGTDAPSVATSGESVATESRPFDVREYGTAAAELARAAAELRATLLEIDRVLDDTRVDRASNRVDESARRATEHATAAAEEIIDHAFRRALYLMGAILLAVAVFRLLTRGKATPSLTSGS